MSHFKFLIRTDNHVEPATAFVGAETRAQAWKVARQWIDGSEDLLSIEICEDDRPVFVVSRDPVLALLAWPGAPEQ